MYTNAICFVHTVECKNACHSTQITVPIRPLGAPVAYLELVPWTLPATRSLLVQVQFMLTSSQPYIGRSFRSVRMFECFPWALPLTSYKKNFLECRVKNQSNKYLPSHLHILYNSFARVVFLSPVTPYTPTKSKKTYQKPH